MLCTLLANSLVVHADETSWSIRSVWAFLSEKVRLLFFGVPKDADTLQKILDPATFAGIVISDDAAIYENFSHAQKCWAHLLRKAIKLTLLEPANGEYRELADRLLEIYRTACRAQRDRRLGDAGRAWKVAAMEDELLDLGVAAGASDLRPTAGPASDYRLLLREVLRLMLANQLLCSLPPRRSPLPAAKCRRWREPTTKPNGRCGVRRKHGRPAGPVKPHEVPGDERLS